MDIWLVLSVSLGPNVITLSFIYCKCKTDRKHSDSPQDLRTCLLERDILHFGAAAKFYFIAQNVFTGNSQNFILTDDCKYLENATKTGIFFC